MTPQGVNEPLGAIDSPCTTAQFQLPVYILSQVLITQNNMKAKCNNVRQIITEPMVTTVTLNYVLRIPALLSLHFVRRFAFFCPWYIPQDTCRAEDSFRCQTHPYFPS